MTRLPKLLEPERLFIAAIVLAAIFAVPWSRDLPVVLNFGDTGALLLPAILAIVAGSIVLQGWRTTNPRLLQNSLGTAACLVAGSVIIGLAILTAVMTFGTGDFFAFAAPQAKNISRWLAFHNPLSLLSMILFFSASVAGLHQPDDSSALDRWTCRGLLFLVFAVMASLWLGAWYDPFGIIAALEESSRRRDIGFDENLALIANTLGIVVFFAKILLLMAIHRAAAKRICVEKCCCQSLARLDILLPVAILNVLATAAYLWLIEPLKDLQRSVSIVVTIAAILLAAAAALFAAIHWRARNTNAIEKS